MPELREFGVIMDVHDPWADPEAGRRKDGLELSRTPQAWAYDCMVLSAAHERFTAVGAEAIHAFGKAEHVL